MENKNTHKIKKSQPSSIRDEDYLLINKNENTAIPACYEMLPSGCTVRVKFDTAKFKREPVLTLPTLRERASRSKIKDLYKISKQLMSSDDEEWNSDVEKTNVALNKENLQSADENQNLISSDTTLEVNEDVNDVLIVPKTKSDLELRPTSKSKIKNAREFDRKSYKSDTSSIRAMRSFKLPTQAEIISAKRNLKILKRKCPSKPETWGLYKKFYLYKTNKHKATQTLLDSQADNCLEERTIFESIYHRVMKDKWLIISLIILLCTTLYIFYITQMDICDWHNRKVHYEHLQDNSYFFMKKWYYAFRIWLVTPS